MKAKVWDKIQFLSGANNVHLYEKNEKKYYVIGEQRNLINCESENFQCDQLNKYPTGKGCTTVEALLDNWLKYNNLYQLQTNFYLNTKNENLVHHFESSTKQCYLRDNKCPYYPNVNVFINPNHRLLDILTYVFNIDIINDNILNELSSLLFLLLDYYEELGYYIFDNKKIKIKDLKASKDIYNLWINNINIPDLPYLIQNYDINRHIKNYGKTIYFDYLLNLKNKHFIEEGELFLKLNLLNNPKKELELFYKFLIQFDNVIQELFDILWQLNSLSQMFINDSPTQIVFTNNSLLYNGFFKSLKIKESINLSSDKNCIKFNSKDIHADEFRWTLYKNTMAKNSIIIVKVKDFNIKIRPQRAGVIIYTYHNDKLYFGFGVDSIYHELTDFGGHLDKEDESAITGALRELKEESLKIFNYQFNDIINDLITYDDQMVIIFVKTDLTKEEINKQFKLKLKTARKPEVNDIKWLSIDELKKELNNNHSKIYNRVKNHLLKSGDFYKLL